MAHLPLTLASNTSAAVGIGLCNREIDDDILQMFHSLQRPLAATRRRLAAAAGHDVAQSSIRDVIQQVGHISVVRGRNVSGRPVRAADQLTARQTQVVALVAEGLTNEQIGRRLGLSPRTVKKHLEAAFARLQVSNRAAAAAWWTDAGS